MDGDGLFVSFGDRSSTGSSPVGGRCFLSNLSSVTFVFDWRLQLLLLLLLVLVVSSSSRTFLYFGY